MRSRACKSGIVLVASGLGFCFGVEPARVALAVPTVHRPLTLPGSSGELDLGLGLGHEDRPAPVREATGLGVNLGFAWGLTSTVELGVRTGLRFGRDGRDTRADGYGRMFETETYDTGHQSIANPEIGIRGALAHGIVDLGIEGRLYLPVEDGTRVGVLVGLPLLIHLGGSARLNTGVYVPIIFRDPVETTVSVPVHLWFQAGPSVSVGLLSGVRFHKRGGHTVPLGAGVGYGLSSAVELRTWLLFPDIGGDGSARNFGGGAGLSLAF